jgi:hypothetical protein
MNISHAVNYWASIVTDYHAQGLTCRTVVLSLGPMYNSSNDSRVIEYEVAFKYFSNLATQII